MLLLEVSVVGKAALVILLEFASKTWPFTLFSMLLKDEALIVDLTLLDRLQLLFLGAFASRGDDESEYDIII